ncbi:uncharacterized protein BDV14DRAFT_147470 [Aspergillus stella-maris]|uniref:uncharacterized protein n=1 Tax=Aspergillus stella-maris TaxID=1810926 RepID=UPI003CCDEB17
MDQGLTVFHKDESAQLRQKEAAVSKKPRRGPLDINEQFALIKICEKRAKFKEITYINTSKFWVEIEVLLEKEIGRRYSHQSCRRRIGELIAQRDAYRDAIKNGIQPPFPPLDSEIRRMLDTWEEMDEFKAQLEREKALGRMVGRDPEVPQRNKLQRVADWVNSLPDPEPPSLITPPSTDSCQSPIKQDDVPALWARYRKIHDYQALARSNNLRAANNDITSSRQLMSNVNEQLRSILHDPRAMQTLTGLKRAREDDETTPDRAAPRPRTQLTDSESMIKPVLKQSPGTSHVLPRIENHNPAPQNPMETVFGKFWESMLPYFKERASKDGLCITRSESIMHDMFKEVGAAMTRAFMKLEQTSRPPAHNSLT